MSAPPAPMKDVISTPKISNYAGDNSSDVVYIYASTTGIDPAGGTFRVSFDIYPPESWSDSRARIIKPFDLYIGLQRVSFANGSAETQTVAQTIAFSSGSIVSYPFDEYKGNISIYLDSAVEPDADLEIDLVLNNVYGFEFQAAQRAEQEIGYREIALTTARSGLFKIYPVFIIVAFWVLIIIMVYFASFVGLWHAKRLDPPVLGLFPALIFALPSFRNTAPASPPIGCLLDFASFFWAMLVAIIGAVVLTVRFILQGNALPAAKPAAPAPVPAAPAPAPQPQQDKKSTEMKEVKSSAKEGRKKKKAKKDHDSDSDSE